MPVSGRLPLAMARLRLISFVVCLCTLLTTSPCTESAPPARNPDAPPSIVNGSLVLGTVVIRGVGGHALQPLSDRMVFSNGTDTFYISKLSDGGTFVLYRYAPPAPTVTSDAYPEINLPGQAMRYTGVIPTSPFYAQQTVRAPFTFPTPFSQLKWPGMVSDGGVGIFAVAESPIFEEAIEPFASAYPNLRLLPGAGNTLRLRFDEGGASPQSVTLNWTASEHTKTTTTYVAAVSNPSTRAIAMHLAQPANAVRAWYRSGKSWQFPQIENGLTQDPDLLLMHTNQPSELLIETANGTPAPQATEYFAAAGYVARARWSAFTIYQRQTVDRFFSHSLAPSLTAFNDRIYTLRDASVPRIFSTGWRDLLRLVGFSNGHNLLNPKFFANGFPVAADPSYQLDRRLNVSNAWVSDEAALQAVMGARLFGFNVDPRYAKGVNVFYDPSSSFYWGAYKRATATFTSADTGGDGVVIGYNYLLALTRLTELIGSPAGLPAPDVQRLVNGVLPLLKQGYVQGYSQVPYLWSYPPLAGLQWEYGMGKELSEAQLSYLCGLWWLRTRDASYLDCENKSIQLPEEYALSLQGSSYLWGLDVVGGGYVMDALLLAYRTTGARSHLDAALSGWRNELLFLFSNFNYPETPFDDRGMTVTSYYSTFADLHTGNYWRGDSWNNSRTLWSLSKVLAYVDDPRIVAQLEASNQTHKQSMPLIDSAYKPVQKSDYYNQPIDPNDFELNYEDLRNHYSTQIAFSVDVWREAFLFSSIRSSAATVFRIPGTLISDPGLAYVIGGPDTLVNLTIQARDCTFADGRMTTQIRLDGSGMGRVPLLSRRT
jgi:hypothetical protein